MSFPRVVRVESLGSPEAEYKSGKIFIADKFFDTLKTSGERLHVLLHELGHWFRDTFVSLVEIMGWEQGENFYIYKRENSEEGFAEAFATFFTDPNHFKRMYPEQFERMKGYIGGKKASILDYAKTAILERDMDNKRLAMELLKLANDIVGASTPKTKHTVVLKLLDEEAVKSGKTNITELKVVKKGKNFKELNDWAKKQGFTPKKDDSLFGGYWVDPENGDSYFFDVE